MYSFPFSKCFFLRKEYYLINYYLLIWFLSFILYESFQSLFNIKTNPFRIFNFYYFQGWLGYVILGGMLRVFHEKKIEPRLHVIGFNPQTICKEIPPRIKRTLPLLIYFLSSSLIVLGTYIASLKQGRPIEIFFSSNNVLVCLQSVSLFVSLISFNHFPRIFSWIAQYTYWIFLIHILCLSFVVKHINLLQSSFVNIPLTILITFIISLCFSVPLLALEKFILLFFSRIFNRT